jgi:hypothetical protein
MNAPGQDDAGADERGPATVARTSAQSSALDAPLLGLSLRLRISA